MFIPGQLISAATFIGVIIHELAHLIFCRLMKVPVFEVKYFQFGNPSGYVLHEKTDRPFASFMITVGPFIVNTILGIVILLPAAVEVIEFKNYTNPVALVLAWLGVSVLMHSFPSTGDAKSLAEAVVKNKNVNLLTRVLVSPVVGLIYLGAIGSMFWLDFLYAIAVGMVLPRLIALAI